MSSTKTQVAMTTNVPNLTNSLQSQKEYNNSTEEPLGRQNSFGNNRRVSYIALHVKIICFDD